MEFISYFYLKDLLTIHSKNHFLQMFSKAFVLSEKNVFKGKESSYFYQQPSTSNAWRKQRIFLCENMRRTKTSWNIILTIDKATYTYVMQTCYLHIYTFFFKWMDGKIKPMPISSLARICVTTYISIYFNTTTIVIIFCWLSMSFLQWPQSVIQFKDGLYLVRHGWVRNQIRGITYLG